MVSKVEIEVEVKSPVDKFWVGVRDSTSLFPKIFPDQYKSIEVIEGDGKSVGTVRLLEYVEGVPIVTFTKEKIEEADGANKLVSYSVIDGEILNFYKNFKATLQLVPKGGDGALAKWCLEFDKASDEVPEPDVVVETARKTLSGLDDYILKN